MDLSDKKAQVLSVEQSKEDERHRVVASAIDTLTAVKRLVTEYDRVKGECNNFERQFAATLVANETLRRQVKEAKDQRDQLSKALATLTNQMDAIGARCIEAAKMARAQTTDARSPAELATMPSTPAARPESNDQGPTTSADRPPADGHRPMEQPKASSIAATACEPITFEVFSRYLRQ